VIKAAGDSAGVGSAVALPLTSHAQQGERVRRIGVLMPYDENDPVAKAFVPALNTCSMLSVHGPPVRRRQLEHRAAVTANAAASSCAVERARGVGDQAG
jgi:hypothetical protein